MFILNEQFGFLFNKEIHNAVGIAQEGLYSIEGGK
jgi:hypothetical protein